METSDSIDEINNEFYNSYAESFDKIPFGDSVTNLIQKYMPEPMQVLEIGSGAGSLAMWMTEHGHKLTCIEPANKPAAIAQKRGLKVCQLRFQDFESDEKFDAVVAISSLIHIPRAEMGKQIERLSSFLKNSGLAIVSFIEGENEGLEDPTHMGKLRFFSKFLSRELLSLIAPYFSILETQRIEVKKMNQFFVLMVLQKPLK